MLHQNRKLNIFFYLLNIFYAPSFQQANKQIGSTAFHLNPEIMYLHWNKKFEKCDINFDGKSISRYRIFKIKSNNYYLSKRYIQFFTSELINPSFRNWYPDSDIFTRNLTPSFCCMIWNHTICSDLNLLIEDGETASSLDWKFPGSRGPTPESHNLN